MDEVQLQGDEDALCVLELAQGHITLWKYVKYKEGRQYVLKSHISYFVAIYLVSIKYYLIRYYRN